MTSTSTKKIAPSRDKSKPFYHENKCRCGKLSYIDNFDKDSQQQKAANEKIKKQKCDVCRTQPIYLHCRTCLCGNCTCVSCYDPNEECDLCNGNIDKMSEDDDDVSEGFWSFIDKFRKQRTLNLKNKV